MRFIAIPKDGAQLFSFFFDVFMEIFQFVKFLLVICVNFRLSDYFLSADTNGMPEEVHYLYLYGIANLKMN